MNEAFHKLTGLGNINTIIVNTGRSTCRGHVLKPERCNEAIETNGDKIFVCLVLSKKHVKV